MSRVLPFYNFFCSQAKIEASVTSTPQRQCKFWPRVYHSLRDSSPGGVGERLDRFRYVHFSDHLPFLFVNTINGFLGKSIELTNRCLDQGQKNSVFLNSTCKRAFAYDDQTRCIEFPRRNLIQGDGRRKQSAKNTFGIFFALCVSTSRFLVNSLLSARSNDFIYGPSLARHC